MNHDKSSIQRALTAIEGNNLDGAEQVLEALAFGQLPYPDETNSEDGLALDPLGASGFHPRNFHLAGEHINDCVTALGSNDQEAARGGKRRSGRLERELLAARKTIGLLGSTARCKAQHHLTTERSRRPSARLGDETKPPGRG